MVVTTGGLGVGGTTTVRFKDRYRPELFVNNANFTTSKVNATTTDTVNLNDANSMYIFKTLRQWSDLIYNPLTGAMGLKKDYTGNILISIFNKQGDVYRRINCRDVFPVKALPEMGLNYTDETIYTINDMEFAVDYWEDLFL